MDYVPATHFWLDTVQPCSCCLARTHGVTDCYVKHRACAGVTAVSDLTHFCKECQHPWQLSSGTCPVSEAHSTLLPATSSPRRSLPASWLYSGARGQGFTRAPVLQASPCTTSMSLSMAARRLKIAASPTTSQHFSTPSPQVHCATALQAWQHCWRGRQGLNACVLSLQAYDNATSSAAHSTASSGGHHRLLASSSAAPAECIPGTPFQKQYPECGNVEGWRPLISVAALHQVRGGWRTAAPIRAGRYGLCPHSLIALAVCTFLTALHKQDTRH